MINGVFSDWVSVTSGVPQGTVSFRSSVLFLLYVNDLDWIITIRLFANDVLLYAPANS